jgi:hypothetical protein
MITIPAILESMRSLKDRTYKLTFETNELTPAQLAEVGSNIQQAGYLAFNKDVFTTEMLDAMKAAKVDYDDPTKTRSQRLRSVLFVYFKQEPMSFNTFEDFYNYHLEKFIDHVKTKLH